MRDKANKVKEIKQMAESVALLLPTNDERTAKIFGQLPADQLMYLQQLAIAFGYVDLSIFPDRHLDDIHQRMGTIARILTGATNATQSMTAQADFERTRGILDNFISTEAVQTLEHSLVLATTLDQGLSVKLKALNETFEGLDKRSGEAVGKLMERGDADLKSRMERLDDLIREYMAKSNEIDVKIKNVNEALIGAKKTAEENAIAAFHTRFSEEARDHNSAANRWLIATALCLAFAFATVAVFYAGGVRNSLAIMSAIWNGKSWEEKVPPRSSADIKEPSKDSKPATTTAEPSKAADKKEEDKKLDPDWWYTVSNRIFFLLLAMFSLHWCGRNYRAHRHQWVLCRQKELAMRTVSALSQAATGADEKNAILRAVTRFVFSHSATGYLGKDEGGPTDKMIEVLNNK